jgi:hypothetical protein
MIPDLPRQHIQLRQQLFNLRRNPFLQRRNVLIRHATRLRWFN